MICTYEKGTGRCFRTNVGNVAQENDFYPKEIERRLNTTVEIPANTVLQKIRQRAAITADDKLLLALYAGAMMKRVPRHRERLAALIPRVMRETFDEFREQMEASRSAYPQYAGNIDHYLSDARRLQAAYEQEVPPHLIRQFEEPWPSADVVGAIAAMTWRFALSAGPSYFLTSDNPLFFFDCWGIGSGQSEITFPLSTTTALHASLQEGDADRHYLPMNQDLVKEVNRRTAFAATRFLFYQTREPWPQALATKKREVADLSRIVWNHQHTPMKKLRLTS
jgi:hypothetical protein